MRLSVVDNGHDADQAAVLAIVREQLRHEPTDVLKTLHYRPHLFGEPFSAALQATMRGPSDWSPGERELFATFVSSLNQCPF
jgi:hypothetical protein